MRLGAFYCTDWRRGFRSRDSISFEVSRSEPGVSPMPTPASMLMNLLLEWSIYCPDFMKLVMQRRDLAHSTVPFTEWFAIIVPGKAGVSRPIGVKLVWIIRLKTP